jgi:toxin HigB-1
VYPFLPGGGGKATGVKPAGVSFHQLKGEYRGFYSVTVTGNNRIIFRFVDGNAVDGDDADDH